MVDCMMQKPRRVPSACGRNKMKFEKSDDMRVTFFLLSDWQVCERSECMRQAAKFSKMLVFLRERVDKVDTLIRHPIPFHSPGLRRFWR